MELLPDDIIIYLLQYMDRKDIYSLSRVNNLLRYQLYIINWKKKIKISKNINIDKALYLYSISNISIRFFKFYYKLISINKIQKLSIAEQVKCCYNKYIKCIFPVLTDNKDFPIFLLII